MKNETGIRLFQYRRICKLCRELKNFLMQNSKIYESNISNSYLKNEIMLAIFYSKNTGEGRVSLNIWNVKDGGEQDFIFNIPQDLYDFIYNV